MPASTRAHRVDRRECELTGGDADALFRRETHWNSHAPSRPYPETWPASLRKIRFVPRQIYQISYISATPEFKVFCTKSRFLLPEGVVMFLSSPQSGHRTRFDKSEIYHIWSASDHPGMKRLHLITIHGVNPVVILFSNGTQACDSRMFRGASSLHAGAPQRR